MFLRVFACIYQKKSVTLQPENRGSEIVWEK